MLRLCSPCYYALALVIVTGMGCSQATDGPRESSSGQSRQSIKNGDVFGAPGKRAINPNLVTVLKNGSPDCSGVLYGSNGEAVLTNAHCLITDTDYKAAFNQLGSSTYQVVDSKLDTRGKTITRIPGIFNGKANDIGLFFLNPPMGRPGASINCSKTGATFPSNVSVHAAVTAQGSDKRLGVKNYAAFQVIADEVNKQAGFAVWPNLFPANAPQWILPGDSGSPTYDDATMGNAQPDLVGLIRGNRVDRLTEATLGLGVQLGPYCQWINGPGLDPNVVVSFWGDLNFDGTEDTKAAVARNGSNWDLTLQSTVLGNGSWSVAGVDPSLDPVAMAVGKFVSSSTQMVLASRENITLCSLTSTGSPSTVTMPAGTQVATVQPRSLDTDTYQDLVVHTTDGRDLIYWGSSTGFTTSPVPAFTWLDFDTDGIPDTVTATANYFHIRSSLFPTGASVAVPSGLGTPQQVIAGRFRDLGTAARQDFAVLGNGHVAYCEGTADGRLEKACIWLDNSTARTATYLAVTDANGDGIEDLEVGYSGTELTRVYYGSASGPTSGSYGTLHGMPSTDGNDGKFLTLSGHGFQTLEEPHLSLKVAVPSGTSQFGLQIFDGDLYGQFDDIVEEADATKTTACYVLWTDPCGDRTTNCYTSNPDAKVEIVAYKADGQFDDGAWTTLASVSTDKRALAPSSNYVYRLDAFLTDRVPAASGYPEDVCNVSVADLAQAASKTANFMNGFKVRSTGLLSLRSGILSFMGMDSSGTYGAPDASNYGWQLKDTNYDGTFTFYFDVGSAATDTVLIPDLAGGQRKLILKEADADHPLGTPTGRGTGTSADVAFKVLAPNSTSTTPPALQRPDVAQGLYPSGNYSAPDDLGINTYPISSPSAGLWTWAWTGVHAINNIYLEATAGSPTTFETFTEPASRIKEASGSTVSEWQATALDAYLPIVLGSKDSNGVATGKSIVVDTRAKALSVLGGSQGSLAAGFLATKLNLARANAVGERLNSAMLYGAPITVRTVVNRLNDVMRVGTATLSSDEQTQLGVLLGAINAGELTYFRPEVPHTLDADADPDNDGIMTAADNCPSIANADQLDTNADNIGDACSLTPRLGCVLDRGNGTLTAYLGYDNPLTFRYVPIGATNQFNSGAEDRGQPMEFLSGSQLNAFAVDIGNNSSVQWVLEGSSITISAQSPRCQGSELLTIPYASQVALYAAEQLVLRDRVTVRTTSDTPAVVISGGTAELDASASVGSVWSASDVSMFSNSLIEGNLVTGRTLTRQAGAQVTGTIVQNSYVAPKNLAWSVTFPTSGSDITLEPGSPPRSIAPGSYGNISIRSASELRLASGTYYLNSLDVAPGARIVLDDSAGQVAVYVKTAVAHKGAITSTRGVRPNLLMGYFGTQDAFFEAPMLGALVAPNAKITLGVDQDGTHKGVFFARKLEVRAGAKVVFDP